MGDKEDELARRVNSLSAEGPFSGERGLRPAAFGLGAFVVLSSTCCDGKPSGTILSRFLVCLGYIPGLF